MLKIFNTMDIFFEDCYKEISVREYSRIKKISAPTASKILKELTKEDLLIQREDKGYLLFKVNRENKLLLDLSKTYWRQRLSKFLQYLKDFSPKAIILFGSLTKLEVKKESDIDIVLIGAINKNFELENFEKEFNKEIQILTYKNFSDINKELKSNIINGFILEGYLWWIGKNANLKILLN